MKSTRTNSKSRPANNRFAYLFYIYKMRVDGLPYGYRVWVLGPDKPTATIWMQQLCVDTGEVLISYEHLNRMSIEKYRNTFGEDGELEFSIPF